ncbi:MAG: VTT domain-containing protein [Planctomycetes bacterium]|nr:VTT domain-containing protein [Planctomycetota bacterium]
MEPFNRCGPLNWGRRLASVVCVWLIIACIATTANGGESGAPVSVQAEEEPNFVIAIVTNLFNSRALLNILSRPEFALAAFITLNVIVFVETGLLFGFFLPGDSLLVTAGVACFLAGWNLPLLLATLCVAAIVGDSVGYSIGLKTGPRIFNREKSWLFRKDHLIKAQEFYERHGGKTIILARFIPIIRTFAPVVAGVARMKYPRFLAFNVVGGVGWVLSMVLIGYFLTRFINPALRPFLGDNFDVQDHIEKVVIIVVLLSISPGIYVWLRSKLAKKPAAEYAEAGK